MGGQLQEEDHPTHPTGHSGVKIFKYRILVEKIFFCVSRQLLAQSFSG